MNEYLSIEITRSTFIKLNKITENFQPNRVLIRECQFMSTSSFGADFFVPGQFDGAVNLSFLSAQFVQPVHMCRFNFSFIFHNSAKSLPKARYK